jgi:hypothetical protein
VHNLVVRGHVVDLGVDGGLDLRELRWEVLAEFIFLSLQGEDGCSMTVKNVGILPHHCIMSQPRRTQTLIVIASSCKHGKEPSGSIKRRENFLTK